MFSTEEAVPPEACACPGAATRSQQGETETLRKKNLLLIKNIRRAYDGFEPGMDAVAGEAPLRSSSAPVKDGLVATVSEVESRSEVDLSPVRDSAPPGVFSAAREFLAEQCEEHEANGVSGRDSDDERHTLKSKREKRWKRIRKSFSSGWRRCKKFFSG